MENTGFHTLAPRMKVGRFPTWFTWHRKDFYVLPAATLLVTSEKILISTNGSLEPMQNITFMYLRKTPHSILNYKHSFQIRLHHPQVPGCNKDLTSNSTKFNMHLKTRGCNYEPYSPDSQLTSPESAAGEFSTIS